MWFGRSCFEDAVIVHQFMDTTESSTRHANFLFKALLVKTGQKIIDAFRYRLTGIEIGRGCDTQK